MKKINLIIVLIVISTNFYSQSPQTTSLKSIGGTGIDRGYSIASDVSGNIYTTGVYTGPADFDSGSGTFILDSTGLFVAKYNLLGSLVWAKEVTGAGGQSISLDIFGNVYVTGQFYGTCDFDPGAGMYNLTSLGSTTDMFVLKLDNLGNFLWAKSFGGPGSSDATGRSIAIDVLGNAYTTGSFVGAVDFDPGSAIYSLTSVSMSGDLFISKLDSFGNFVWAKSIGPTISGLIVGNGMQIDNIGNIYITGQFQGATDFDSGTGTYTLTPASLSPDIFILKVDSLGNFIWAKNIGGTDYDIAYSIALDSIGNVYTTGIFQNTVDFDPGVGVYNLIGSISQNIFISKLDSSGNFIFAKTLVSNSYANQAKSITVDDAGSIYTVGGFIATADFNPDTAALAVYNLTCVSGASDGYISKLDNLGNFVWAKSIGGTHTEICHGVILDSYKNIYVIGEFGSPIITSDFNTINNANTSGGTADIFISRMGQDQDVWPGDANNDYNVDNTDLLPIGLYYGQLGVPRDSISNLWQANASTDWGALQINGFDIKHADCNGDSLIDANDTLAVNMNFSLAHTITTNNDFIEVRSTVPNLYFVTSSSVYNPGDMIDVEVWAGSTLNPVDNLYGLAFSINYDASLVQPGSESLTFPISWMGTPGTNLIKIGKVDALANTAYGALTRINHSNADGYGKIANFKFQAKTTIVASSFLPLNISNYVANDSIGIPAVFNVLSDSLLINVSVSGMEEKNNSQEFVIYPNPNNGIFNVIIDNGQKIVNGQLSIYNTIGEKIYSKSTGQLNNVIVDLSGYTNGMYFIHLETENSNSIRKIIINK